MQIRRMLILLLLLGVSHLAAADTYQLWLERFDETTGMTVCLYRSDAGKDAMSEYVGRYLCPRVACTVPPTDDRQEPPDCAPRDVPS